MASMARIAEGYTEPPKGGDYPHRRHVWMFEFPPPDKPRPVIVVSNDRRNTN